MTLPAYDVGINNKQAPGHAFNKRTAVIDFQEHWEPWIGNMISLMHYHNSMVRSMQQQEQACPGSVSPHHLQEWQQTWPYPCVFLHQGSRERAFGLRLDTKCFESEFRGAIRLAVADLMRRHEAGRLEHANYAFVPGEFTLNPKTFRQDAGDCRIEPYPHKEWADFDRLLAEDAGWPAPD